MRFRLPIKMDSAKSLCARVIHILRHPKQAFFQAKTSRIAKAEPTNTKKRRRTPDATEPANANKRAKRDHDPQVEPLKLSKAGVNGIAEIFEGFDGVHAAAYIDLSEESNQLPSSSSAGTSPVTDLSSLEQSILEENEREAAARPTCSTGNSSKHITKAQWQSEYKHLRKLAVSSQGQIDIFLHKPTATRVVVKKINTPRQCDPLNEPKMLRDFLKPHTNIIQLQSLFYNNEARQCRLILEYCEGGDLWSFVEHWQCVRNEYIPEIYLLHFIAGMGSALGYLHLGKRFQKTEGTIGMPRITKDADHKPVLHRDIKLENIFLRWSENSRYGLPDIVLADFGGSILAERSANTATFGTPGCYPPELIRHEQLRKTDLKAWNRASKAQILTKASDVFTFGVCLFNMISRYEYKASVDVESEFRRSSVGHWPLLLAMLKHSLADDPKLRLRTEALFNWSPILDVHVAYLYEHGVRMPENSWPEPLLPVLTVAHPTSSSYSQSPGAEPAGHAYAARDNHEKPVGRLVSETSAAKILERMAGGHFSSTSSSEALGRVQSQRAELVSEFSDDSDEDEA